MAKDVTSASFQADVLDSARPVLVDFWAEWCGPCRMVSPILDEISVEYADKISIVKVNVDNEPALAEKYGITGIPAQGRLVDAAWRVNEVLDQIEAVFRESMTVVSRMGAGDFSRQPQIVGLRGLYPEVLTQIALVQKNMATTVQLLNQSMRAMAEGNFDLRVSTQGQSGEFLDILNDARSTTEVLDTLISDVVRVMDGVSRGDLSNRVKAQGAGALGKLKDDINLSLESLANSMQQLGENAQQVAGAASDTSTKVST